MDPIVIVTRASKTPAYPDPAGAITLVENDANITNLKTACDQLDAEKLDAASAVAVTATKPSPVDADQLIMLDSAASGSPVLVTKAQLLSGVGGSLSPLALWDYWYSVRMGTTGAAASDMFAGAAVSSGTNNTAIPTGGQAGFNSHGVFLRSSTTANGGYRYQTSSLVADYFGVISHKFRCQFLWRTSFTGRTVRLGYHDSSTSADATDGAYFEIVAAVCSAKTASNSTRTTDATTLTLALDTAYTFDIDVNAAGTSAQFRVYGGTSETALLDVTITTNIPTTSARAFGAGIVATESSTTASDIGILYSLGLGTVEGFARAAGAVSSTPSATAPSAFVAGDWTATAGDTQITLNITTLPANGGSAITALEYRLNSGTAVALSGTGTGVRTITGLTNDTAYAVEIRAVNAIGAAAWSDVKSRTPVAASGPTFIRFATLSGMTETGNATTGWIYTGTATDGDAGGSDYTLASGVAGGMVSEILNSGGSTPVVGFYTVSTGTWDANYHLLVYPTTGNWYVNGPGFSDLVTTARTYVSGDLIRITFDATNGFAVDIARAAAPTTWLSLAVGTLARAATLYPRLTSFSASGAVFTEPYVV